jgi:hypothetical protein
MKLPPRDRDCRVVRAVRDSGKSPTRLFPPRDTDLEKRHNSKTSSKPSSDGARLRAAHAEGLEWESSTQVTVLHYLALHHTPPPPPHLLSL